MQPLLGAFSVAGFLISVLDVLALLSAFVVSYIAVLASPWAKVSVYILRLFKHITDFWVSRSSFCIRWQC